MSEVSPSHAEQHLGDRLAALVDGELSHDVRERVLAHLATCAKCKAEADAQRRLKSLFVESAPPPLSAGLLARLQGLPGGSLDGSAGPPGPGGTFGPGGPAGPPGSAGSAGPPGADPFASFGYAVPVSPREGFRIHEVGRSRRRFAFVAAGAVSLAAIALGGPLSVDAVEPNARGEVPATQPGPAMSVADLVVRDRMPSPGGVPSLRTTGPQPPVSPSAPASARPVSLSR